MNDIISAINHVKLIATKAKRGDMLFTFDRAFLSVLDGKVAYRIQKDSGGLVAAFNDDEPRKSIANRDLFNAKSQEVFREGFSERLCASVEELTASLKKEPPNDRLSYNIAINLRVGCGETSDQALFELQQ